MAELSGIGDVASRVTAPIADRGEKVLRDEAAKVLAGHEELGAVPVVIELAKLGAGLQYLDVGGGLGVDYDGSQTNFESSANYTLQEYANDVVYHVQSVCDEAGVAHPTIISESGRAVV